MKSIILEFFPNQTSVIMSRVGLKINTNPIQIGTNRFADNEHLLLEAQQYFLFLTSIPFI